NILITVGEKLKIVLIIEAAINQTMNHGNIFVIDVSVCFDFSLRIVLYVKNNTTGTIINVRVNFTIAPVSNAVLTYFDVAAITLDVSFICVLYKHPNVI